MKIQRPNTAVTFASFALSCGILYLSVGAGLALIAADAILVYAMNSWDTVGPRPIIASFLLETAGWLGLAAMFPGFLTFTLAGLMVIFAGTAIHSIWKNPGNWKADPTRHDLSEYL